MLECVINVSEGRDPAILEALSHACRRALLDVHTDAHHHRSVLTLAGPDVERAARSLAAEAVALLDLRAHSGQHPRIGVVDVVPFVPVPGGGSDLRDALEARDRFVEWAASALQLPCFSYGPERSLPDVRRHAFRDLAPAAGPATPHPSAGACAVGARDVLVAYNLWLEGPDADLARAKRIAKELRRPGIRAIGLDLDGAFQVSCNLVDPLHVGPDAAYDLVAERTGIARAELVGLVPRATLHSVDPKRWSQLDLAPEKTIEARLQAAGLDEGKV